MIDPKKVLLVVNSADSRSNDVADYYIAKRGLRPANKLALSMPVTNNTFVNLTTAQVFSNLVTPVAAAMAAAPIDAVLLSAFTPFRYTMAAGANGALANLLGHALYYKNVLGRMPDGDGTVVSLDAYNHDQLAGGAGAVYGSGAKSSTSVYGQVPAGTNLELWTPRIFNWFGNPHWRPHGRIGMPDFTGLHPEDVAAVQRVIDDAAANEESTASAIAKGKSLHFGLHDRVSPYIMGLNGELGRLCSAARGLPTKHYRLTYSATWTLQPPADSYDRTSMLAGTLTPKQSAWGMVGAAIMNEPIPSPFTNSYLVQPGGWMYEATSNGLQPGVDWIYAGGCASVGSFNEPYANTIPKTDAFTRAVLSGMSMCEAMLLSGHYGGWMADAIGDPLYAPFGKNNYCGSRGH